MATFDDIYNPNRHYLPPGILFEGHMNRNTFLPTWKGQVLFIALDSSEIELKLSNNYSSYNEEELKMLR